MGDFGAWHDVLKADRYEIYECRDGYFAGRIVDTKGEVVHFMGMAQDSLYVSPDRERTERNTKKVFDEFIKTSRW